ncbi:putative quinol monooxygenase [Facilibium subflavum]|uniref:putative quinol monooxygenase n=1 Tax=Facilibium subflavum TaxID=2219058 RepID=UPI000E648CF7|nr:putative quinol monooxygenase [Facilibium subflavum]
MGKIVCIARFNTLDGKYIELIDSLKRIQKKTLLEEGCLKYTIHRSVGNLNNIMVYEKFTGMEEFKFHQETDYIVDLKSNLPLMVDIDNVSIELYEDL